MKKTEMKKVAQGIFKDHPARTEVFVASDGQAFFERMHAQNHATKNTLEVERFVNEASEKEAEKTE